MAAAVPFAIKGGAMLAGSLLGKKLSGPSKQQSAAMTGTQQSANALSATSQPLMGTGLRLANQGAGDLSAASGYYRNILGSRAGMRQALAPETASALDYYRGASGKIGRTMRGGARDEAQAELDRQKVGNLAMMLPTARANAAAGLAGVGGSALSGGASFTGQGANTAADAAYVNSGLFNQASQLRNQQETGGKGWGSFLYDVASQLPWAKGKGGGGGGNSMGSSLFQGGIMGL